MCIWVADLIPAGLELDGDITGWRGHRADVEDGTCVTAIPVGAAELLLEEGVVRGLGVDDIGAAVRTGRVPASQGQVGRVLDAEDSTEIGVLGHGADGDHAQAGRIAE